MLQVTTGWGGVGGAGGMGMTWMSPQAWGSKVSFRHQYGTVNSLVVYGGPGSNVRPCAGPQASLQRVQRSPGAGVVMKPATSSLDLALWPQPHPREQPGHTTPPGSMPGPKRGLHLGLPQTLF